MNALDPPADLPALLQLLGALAPRLFQAAPLLLSRAPGRLDVMGGFADYSGSLTLELPIAEATYVAAQPQQVAPGMAASVEVVSAGFAPGGEPRRASFPLAELRAACESYASAREYFQRDRSSAWAAYVAGVYAALRVELGLEPRGGMTLLVVSSVPEGKGVSSSAALEVATLGVLAEHHGVRIDPVRAALLCQRVENLVVGAPCGVMDQMTSSCGRAGHLLPILCQPGELQPSFPVPRGLALWGIDSGLRHEVSGADYGEVRVAAFMGYRWLAEQRGLEVRASAQPGQVTIVDPEWGGYLARLPRSEFEQRYRALLPERIGGAEFLERFAGISDPITRVRPGSTYRVRAATAHPVCEHARASEFRELLQSEALRSEELRSEELGSAPHAQRALLERLGSLMYETHKSYSDCGLGSSGTDRLVELVRELGPERGLFGAKITGGGSGGTVAVLGLASAAAAVREVAERYQRETGRAARVFSGSSPGAAAFGVRRLQLTAGGWRLEE
ncbi:MAG TPA: galactokinase family protein [Polyangiaceae bacterium]|jgi:L-arabinokinase|nr:galactokinase family protein [Polyangiaceae bacterium]